MKILNHQIWHLIFLSFLLSVIYFCLQVFPELLAGELWNIPTKRWLFFTISIPIVHQLYVLVCWRSELFYKGLSSHLGNHSFGLYKLGFAALFLLRPISVLLLAISNKNTFSINPLVSYTLSGLFLILSGYLFYSVKNYFGINRAFGQDHFKAEVYRDLPMVTQGVFKYTSNGMYVLGFLVLYVPGLLLFSKAALLAALFNHLYIWVHYYFTELPDIKVIYKKS